MSQVFTTSLNEIITFLVDGICLVASMGVKYSEGASKHFFFKVLPSPSTNSY